MLTGTARLLKDRDPLIGGQSAVQGQGGEPKQRSGVSPGQSIGISGPNQPVRAPLRVLPLRLGLSGPAFPHHQARLAAGWLGNLSAYSRATRVSEADRGKDI